MFGLWLLPRKARLRIGITDQSPIPAFELQELSQQSESSFWPAPPVDLRHEFAGEQSSVFLLLLSQKDQFGITLYLKSIYSQFHHPKFNQHDKSRTSNTYSCPRCRRCNHKRPISASSSHCAAPPPPSGWHCTNTHKCSPSCKPKAPPAKRSPTTGFP